MKFGLLLMVTLTFVGCTKDETKIHSFSDLKGKWIEIATRTDTLFFARIDNLDFMNLERGKEIREGNLVPKLASGPYEYKLEKGKIALRWISSSNSNFNMYYFKITNNRLTIGNFYSLGSTETLTFEKFE